MNSPLVTAAASYLSRGLAVIALTGKTPNVSVHRQGLHQPLEGAPESSADFDLLARVFDHPDTTGIAIVIRYPYVVVDIDGEEGAQQWADILGEPVPHHATWIARTGRGLHCWYTCITPTGTIKLGPKLDLKAQGGYVAAPPSKHPDGHTYEWLLPPGDEPVKEVPEALQTIIDYHAAQKTRRLGGKDQRRAIPVKVTLGGVTYVSKPSFDGVIEAMTKAEEGNRNHMLYWAAATIVEEGGLAEDLENLAEAALAVGLEREETRRTIRSAARLDG